MTDRQYPNVKLRLRRTSGAPGAPDRESPMVLWLDGSRFHLCDERGRSFGAILADVTSPRGFGQVARTMEDFMDSWAASSARQPTDLFADLTADRAVVIEEGGEPWTTDATQLVGLADQVIANRPDDTATAVGQQDRLGRPCIEYRDEISGEEDGVPFHSVVSSLVSEPYVLRREVRDHPAGRLFALTEVVELDEGVVTEKDLTPPAG